MRGKSLGSPREYFTPEAPPDVRVTWHSDVDGAARMIEFTGPKSIREPKLYFAEIGNFIGLHKAFQCGMRISRDAHHRTGKLEVSQDFHAMKRITLSEKQ